MWPYLQHSKLDFDGVKSKVGLLSYNDPTIYEASHYLVSYNCQSYLCGHISAILSRV